MMYVMLMFRDNPTDIEITLLSTYSAVCLFILIKALNCSLFTSSLKCVSCGMLVIFYLLYIEVPGS